MLIKTKLINSRGLHLELWAHITHFERCLLVLLGSNYSVKSGKWKFSKSEM